LIFVIPGTRLNVGIKAFHDIAEYRGEARVMRGSARQQERVVASIPVQIEGGAKGETLNVSPSGILFETDAKLREDAPLHLTLEFESPSGKFYLECTGEIVRVEAGDGRTRVAARIKESRFERRVNGTPRQGAHT
jgi:hypothetical protein